VDVNPNQFVIRDTIFCHLYEYVFVWMGASTWETEVYVPGVIDRFIIDNDNDIRTRVCLLVVVITGLWLRRKSINK